MKKFGSFFLYLCPTAARTFPAICSIIFLPWAFPCSGKICGMVMEQYTNSFTEIYTDLVVLWSNNRFNTSVMILFFPVLYRNIRIVVLQQIRRQFLPEHPGFFRPCSIFGIILLAPATQVLTSFLISIIAMIFPAWLKAYETLIESAGMNDVTLPVICYSVLRLRFRKS